MKFYKPGPAQIPGKRPAKVLHVSSVFWWCNPVRLYSFQKNVYP